jgi:hypothetical protein
MLIFEYKYSNMINDELEAFRQYLAYRYKHFSAFQTYLFFPFFRGSSGVPYPYQPFCCFCTREHFKALLLAFKSFRSPILDAFQQILLLFHK